MEQRDKIIELIFDEDENAFIDWVQSQPLILQPDIFREFKEISAELMKEAGEMEIPELEMLDKQTDVYEECIMDELLEEVKLDIAIDDRDKTEAEIAERIDGIRAYIIGCITSNADNAEAMKELAKKIIALEKESGNYDAENWKEIL